MQQRNSQNEPVRTGDSDAAANLARALSDPLNGLLAMGELLQRQPLIEPARAQLQAMLDAARRMSGMVCDAIETPDMSTAPALTPTSLRDVVDDVEARWRSHRRDDAAQFLISYNAPPDLRVMADPARLRRLLNTLIQDAFEARAWGVVEVRLNAQLQADGVVAIAGRLDAPGADISSCDPIALELCQAIVRPLNGDITRAPSRGAGVQTTFTFQAPEVRHDLPAELDVTEAQGPLPPRTHLLIVDDNATNRIVAAALCEMFGCTSETAEDGLEAVEAVKSRHFDLILMDIKMPRMDGLLATKTIRALETSGAATPIVALTANADADAVATYLASGMQGVVDKPIKPDHLLATLQWVLCGPDDVVAPQSSAA
jgi:CheY-like chemotaxis protein